MTKVAPWSFSRLKSFEQCPKQFYHEKILKAYPFVQTEAILYGNEFHKAAENFIGKDEPVAEKFSYAQKALENLKGREGDKHCELKLGITEDLQPCGFYDKDVWFRGIADLIIVNGSRARVVDYKTGKSARYADKGQLELMALSVFAHFPEVETVNAALFFVVCRDLVQEKYAFENKEELWKKWITKYNAMAEAAKNDVWNPRPSGLCRRHCPVVECPHNGVN